MQSRRYVAELFGVLAVYAVVLVASLRALDGLGDGPIKVAVALAPMAPACLVPWVVVRRLRALDELQRTIQLEALGIAFAGTAVATFGWGFAELAGLPHLPAFGVWPLMATFWMFGLLLARGRYA